MHLAEDRECRPTLVCLGCEPWDNVTPIHYVQTPYTYHYAIFAFKLVRAGRVGLALVARTTSLVCVVKGIEVVVIDAFAVKDIGDEFRDRRLPDSRLSNEKDGVWCFRVVRRTLDDSLLERLYVTGK